ncbi:trehalose utilization protein ThuA [Staphylococcus succinus]|jgi:trehalose utilization protein|uniref:Trehalose utilization protein ThuA n=1 Tax=Staphylococcus succinus TaxID=61015 RepID=A0A9Q6HMF4_9STAP|nr:ThuA domain-containing protein [Staphylococcus succinus]MEB8125802.1 ThuA domain-containing protein [Staphylococcus succinus]MEB8210944.1 ThuA domain-containing protein [Staphylococcus succinus]PTI42410.1 trehalose utilization protein ThuA [Staphylococcus succinus]PTI74267.1 trehalose utilization protein ThuA [Staphylococcus succinus]PTJ20446.1 trehalose utilization protein ThuA [Staphylococcus succinus]
MNITIWNEYRHERENVEVKKVYPEGIHHALASFLKEIHHVETATLDEVEHGLTEQLLEQTDVLIWWGHKAHEEVDESVVERVKSRVLDGMGLVVLHSAHFSKIFKSLMGTTCDLKWREADEKERLWVVDPTHPIVEGIDSYIELEQEEMYGEHFDIPVPDETVLISWFEGGEVFRSGVTFKRGNGKIFYFRPGHESYPTYYNKQIQQIIKNGVKWACNNKTPKHQYGNAQPLEKIDEK